MCFDCLPIMDFRCTSETRIGRKKNVHGQKLLVGEDKGNLWVVASFWEDGFWSESVGISERLSGQRPLRLFIQEAQRHAVILVTWLNQGWGTLPYWTLFTVPSKSIGAASSIPLFLLYAENIWISDRKMNVRQMFIIPV